MAANFSRYRHVKWQSDDNNRKSTLSWRYYHSNVDRITASVVANWDQNFSRSALSVLTCDPHSAATSAPWILWCFLIFFHTLFPAQMCFKHRLNKCDCEFLFPSDGSGCIQVGRIYISLPHWSDLPAAGLLRWQMIGCPVKTTHCDSVRWQVLFPTKCTKIHLLWGCDPVKVRALFFKSACLDWSKSLDSAFSVADPVC